MGLIGLGQNTGGSGRSDNGRVGSGRANKSSHEQIYEYAGMSIYQLATLN